MSKYLASNISVKRIITTLYFVACFIFFAFFYKYHFYYIEQLQLFRLSLDYIAEYFHKPASLSCLIGDFLTQFYYLKAGGAIIITSSLLLFWVLFDKILSGLLKWKYSYLISKMVTALATCLHFNIVYPLAATISVIISLATFLLYRSQTRLKYRIIGGIILIPILYLSSGFGIYLFLFFVFWYEFKIAPIKNWFVWIYITALVLLGVFFPTLMRTHYYLTNKQARIYPITELAKLRPNFVLEYIFALDCEWHFNKPEKTIEIAKKATIKNPYVTYYYNLASAATNKLPENLLSYNQMGLDGMFIPHHSKETNFISLIFGNEVYYFIGDINASEHFALMANTFSPKGESSRMIRRMVETNIINSEFAVAEKYIKMLKQTLFYRKWAQGMEQYLNNNELCSKTQWIANKRALMPVVDHIKSDPNNFTSSLYFLLEDHPDNKEALNYLLTICLLYKDYNGFYKALTTYNKSYKNLPKLYQEALLVYFGVNKADQNRNSFQIPEDVIQHSKLFKKKYHQYNGNSEALIREFGSTYWFYFTFATIPN